MTTQYTPILKLALPVEGELDGTWGDVVNENITSMVEQAIAGAATINTWTANVRTLTTANGTTSESRCAMLIAQTGAGGTALTAAGQIICPAATKLYVLRNESAFAVTLKTASGSGVAVAAGNTAFLFCDGTNVNACVTTMVDGNITGNLTVGGTATVGGAAVTTASNSQTLTNKTLNSAVLNDGYTEEVFAITDGATVNLDPNNGSIQTWTLGASRTPGQINWASGQSITLQVDDGTAFTITWTTLAVVWKTNSGVAPPLNTTGFTVIVLWKVGTTIFGARVGDA